MFERKRSKGITEKVWSDISATSRDHCFSDVEDIVTILRIVWVACWGIKVSL